MSQNGSRWRSWGTPIVMAVLVVAAIAWLVATGKPPQTGNAAGGARATDSAIRESAIEDSIETAMMADVLRPGMSLLDIERSSGVPADSLIAELRLPPDVSKEWPLRTLMRVHNLTTKAVWDARERIRARQRR